MHFRSIFTVLLILGSLSIANGQSIEVNPTGVNVNSQNATTVFLTFGQIPAGYVPAEALWCGELIPATAPALGLQCRPDTIYGSLPARYNLSQSSGNAGFTDIMAIPPSIVRRAYLAAVRGASAGFFYVRRFVSTTGGPDQFVNVTCRMTGGGARVPFALTNVDIKTPDGEPILFLRSGERLPEIVAEIQYNGTGRLKGRWEIVQPGEEPPSPEDLLTEATLPLERRGTQRRYTQIARFNEFLLPTGKHKLRLDSSRTSNPLIAAGQYYLLLRIEAVDDKESDSDLGSLGVGVGVVHSGAVASFPMPVVRLFVAGAESEADVWQRAAQISSKPLESGKSNQPIKFEWKQLTNASIYRVEVLDENSAVIFSSYIRAPATSYHTPPWVGSALLGRTLKWRITAFDVGGALLKVTDAKPIS